MMCILSSAWLYWKAMFVCTSSLSPWWRLEHSVETSASSSWKQITFSSFVWLLTWTRAKDCKMLFMVILALVSLPTLSVSQLDNTNLPLTYPARVINATEQACPPNEVQVNQQNELAQDIQGLLRTVAAPSCQVFQTQSSPAASCSTLPTSCPSGYYWVRSSNGSAVQVYCDMNRVCGCDDTGGWTRVANLNMTDQNQQCPGAWMLQNYTTEPRRLCRNCIRYGCLSATFNTYGIHYGQVCGRIILPRQMHSICLTPQQGQ